MTERRTDPAPIDVPVADRQPSEIGAAIDPTWAESAEMNAVSDDGRTGFSARLARYPGTGIAWLWLSVFTPDSIFGYNDNALPLTGDQGITLLEHDTVTYALPGEPGARLHRVGSRAAIESVAVSAAVPGHRGPHPPLGPGTERLAVEATFRPRHMPASARPRRLEALGQVEARLTTPDGEIDLAGLGHWHEQYGLRPQFARRFTYATLRGQQLAFIATRTASLDTGFAVRGEGVTDVRTFDIDPPGPERAFRLALADGEVIEGRALQHHAFSVAIEGRRRPSTAVLVRSSYGTLTGFINDWQPDEGGA
jgi:hypothetical protein